MHIIIIIKQMKKKHYIIKYDTSLKWMKILILQTWSISYIAYKQVKAYTWLVKTLREGRQLEKYKTRSCSSWNKMAFRKKTMYMKHISFFFFFLWVDCLGNLLGLKLWVWTTIMFDYCT